MGFDKVDAPDKNGNKTNEGSGYEIGDGIVLTAGHNIYAFNYDPSNPQPVPLRNNPYQILNGNGFRDYLGEFQLLVMNWNFQTAQSTNPCTGIISTVQRSPVSRSVLRKVDTVFIVDGGKVGRNDAGVVLFLDPNDINSSDYQIGLSGDDVRVRWKGLRTDPNDASLNYDPTSGFIASTTIAAQGDSGGAIRLDFKNGALNVGDREFILGNIHSVTAPFGCVDQYGSALSQGSSQQGFISGQMRGNAFLKDEFYALMGHLAVAQSGGDVTRNDPTNLIIGSADDDINAKGSYRADIILGRGGSDFLTAGDIYVSDLSLAAKTVYADDQLYGGAGDDTIAAGFGNDLIHGGDFRKYGGSRIDIANDGDDTVKFHDDIARIRLRIGSPDDALLRSTGNISAHAPASERDALEKWKSIIPSTEDDFSKIIIVQSIEHKDEPTFKELDLSAPPPPPPPAPIPKSITGLISIEKLEGTAGSDELEIFSFTDGNIVKTGNGGLREIDFKDEGYLGDTVILSEQLAAVTINFSNSTSQTIQTNNDANAGLTVKNAENAIGTNEADTFYAVEKGLGEKGSIFIGRDGQNTFHGSLAQNFFHGGKHVDKFYLKAGDTAIGGAGADEFYIDLGSSSLFDVIQNKFLLPDFDSSEDKIYVNSSGSETYTQFTGFDKTTTFTQYLDYNDGEGSGMQEFAYVQETTGTGSYDIEIPTATVVSGASQFSGPQFTSSTYKDVAVAKVNAANSNAANLQFIDAQVTYGENGAVQTATFNKFASIFIGDVTKSSALFTDTTEVKPSQDSPAPFIKDYGSGFPSYEAWIYNRQVTTSENSEGAPVSISLDGTSGDGFEFGKDRLNFGLATILPTSQTSSFFNSLDDQISYRLDNNFTIFLPFSRRDFGFSRVDEQLKNLDLPNDADAAATADKNLMKLGILPAGSVSANASPDGGNTSQGTESADNFNGTTGSDFAFGGAGNDTFNFGDSSGTQVDIAVGGTGDDLYILGDSFDKSVIAERIDSGDLAGGNDTLQLGVASTDVTVVAGNSPDDLRIVLADLSNGNTAVSNPGIVTLVGQLGTDSDNWIEQVVFSDNVTWTRSQLIAETTTITSLASENIASVNSDEDAFFELSLDSLFSDILRRDTSYSATLANGDPLPEWLSVANGILSGQPEEDFNGTISVSVTATAYADALTANLDLIFDPVNDAPIAQFNIANQFVSGDDIINYTLPVDAFSDIDGDTLTYSATLLDDSALPSWLTFDGNSFSGTVPTDYDELIAVKVTASDGAETADDIFFIVPGGEAPELVPNLQTIDIANYGANAIYLDDWPDLPPTGKGLNLIDDEWPRDVGYQTSGNGPTNGQPISDWPAWIFDETEWTVTQGPYGQDVVSLNAGQTDTDNGGGGAISNDFTVDGGKAYEFTYYFKKDIPAGQSAEHNLTFTLSNGTVADPQVRTADPQVRTADAAATESPYPKFLTLTPGQQDTLLENDRWYKVVGYVLPDDADPELVGAVGGLYDTTTGEKIADTNAFKWHENLTNNQVSTRMFTGGGGALGLYTHFHTPEAAEIDERYIVRDGEKLNLRVDSLTFNGVVVEGFANFTANALDAEARWREVEGPDGLPITVMQAGQFDTSADGGGNATNKVDIDKDRAYKYTQYIRKSDLTKHNLAISMAAFGDNGVAAREKLTDGSAAQFGSFLSLNTAQQQANLSDDKWYKLVAYVLPQNSALDTTGTYGGLFDADTGAKVQGINVNAYRWAAGAENISAYVSYATNGDHLNHGWSTYFDQPELSTVPVAELAADVADPLGTSAESRNIMQTIEVSSMVTDADNNIADYTIDPNLLPSKGTVSIDAITGTAVYKPYASSLGEDSFSVIVTDGNGNQVAVPISIDLYVPNVNQAPDVPENGFAANVDEHVSAGTLVTTISTTDPEGDGGLDYMFVDSYITQVDGKFVTYSADGRFRIERDTGKVIANTDDLDFETGPDEFNYDIRISDRNSGWNSRANYTTLSIAINDVDETQLPPVILDLDGDGVELVSITQSQVLFDMDGDGNLDRAGWFGADDGVLVYDQNGNNIVDNGNEISFQRFVQGAFSDLEGLTFFDTDGNGLLDGGDAEFASFKVWRDLNQDGVTNDGELLTLTDMGIVDISLTGTPTGLQPGGSDNVLYATSTYTNTDGSTGIAGDTFLVFAPNAAPPVIDRAPSTDGAGNGDASNMDAALPTVMFASMDFARKSKKYRVHSENGALMIGSKKLASDTMSGATIMTFKNRTVGMLSPIILDLDGDGIDMKGRTKTHAMFDMDGNGSRDDTGWVGKGDGLLVVDRNNDGIINDGSELSFLADAPDAGSDLQALSAFDSNGDGIVSALDVRFRELKVWVDTDQDGVTDAGELKTLADHGIASVSLNGQATNDRVKVGKNILLATSTFTRTDGSTGTVGDVAFAFKPTAALSGLVGAGGVSYKTGPRTYTERQIVPEREYDRMNFTTFGLPDGYNPFDYFETIKLPDIEAPEGPVLKFPAANTGDEEAKLVKQQYSVQTEAYNGDDDTQQNHQEVVLGSIEGVDQMHVVSDDVRLALMRQDIASFGGGSGSAADLKIRDRHAQPVDYFAA